MLCSFLALTPKAHTLKQEGDNFYINVHEILDAEGNMDVAAFWIYVTNLAADWGIILHQSWPVPSLDRMARVVRGHRNGATSLFVFVFA